MHYAEEKVPTEDTVLKQRRIGVGTNANLYPVNVNIEAGKRIKLHDKSYLSLATSYQFNQRWRFDLSGNLNGSGTPIKAINQGFIRKISVSVQLIPIVIYSVSVPVLMQ
ncbi:biofilm PGA synthesis protein PgaA [Actinobacillus equuli]|nr:biofilm PGA synthesis protein PgaA [Actinobacillus equuli]